MVLHLFQWLQISWELDILDHLNEFCGLRFELVVKSTDSFVLKFRQLL